jgi:transglycosylase-like protein with SLT domain
MRPSWWAFILVGVVTGSVLYQLTNESSVPDQAPVVADVPAPQPLEQKSELTPAEKDQARVQDVELAPAESKQDQLPVAQQDQLPVAQQEARLEDASRPEAVELTNPTDTEPSSPSDSKQNLSWLAYYAYSELPPDPKPANIVLSALSTSPPGTPIEEIRRVAGVLGLDATFMKAVAKVESGFNPKQRTGSYIGLFQLSQAEFDKYGSGDIRDPRDNTVAASLKFMTEGILFETFTHRKPTMNDLYLIHQQGVDGASEHISHPGRLAWRSMCATDEGKEKGEKWCKRAIWGNTLPAIKKAWKNVNNVTSAAFVGMWQQRVSDFYSRYSQAAAN